MHHIHLNTYNMLTLFTPFKSVPFSTLIVHLSQILSCLINLLITYTIPHHDHSQSTNIVNKFPAPPQ